MPRIRLTPAFVVTATSQGKAKEVYWDENLPGFGLAVTSYGHRSFVLQYRNAAHQSRRLTLSGDLEEARRQARVAIGQIADGVDPLALKRQAKEEGVHNSLRVIADKHLRYLEDEGMKSIAERRRTFENHIFPKFGSRPIASIKRSDVRLYEDDLRKGPGPHAALKVHGALQALFNWWADRDDDFHNPMAGMKGPLTKDERQGRKRTLTDDELRLVWKAATETYGPYGYLVRFLLLTAARLREASEMTRDEVSADGLWTIPAERHKTGGTGTNGDDKVIPLSAAAQELLRTIPRPWGESKWIFTWTGLRPMQNFSHAKWELDFKITALNNRTPIERWTNHDLRRTARTLLARAGVSSEIAERCLGHGKGGIEAVYNRYRYIEEMREAFEKLASLLDRIVNPPLETNIIPLVRS
jgi:integrase